MNKDFTEAIATFNNDTSLMAHLRKESKARLHAAFYACDRMKTATDELISLGRNINSAEHNYTYVFNEVLECYFEEVCGQLVKTKTNSVYIDLAISLDQYLFGTNLELRSKLISCNNADEAIELADKCLDNIDFKAICDDLAEQYLSIDAKQRAKAAERLFSLMGFAAMSNGRRSPKTTKKSISIQPGFFVCERKLYNEDNVSNAQELQSIFELMDGVNVGTVIADLLEKDKETGDELLPRQKFKSHDLTIEYFASKHMFICSYRLIDSICAFLCLHGNEAQSAYAQEFVISSLPKGSR